MGKNLDGLSIIVAILNTANPTCSKTRILKQTNLSFCFLEKYLSIVTESNLINVLDCKYRLTERGHDFLGQHKQFEENYSKANRTILSLRSERERLILLISKKNSISNLNGFSR